MKNLLMLLLISASISSYAVVRVKGYTKKDGTYVQPHYRSDPDKNPYNNWSTKGNINPYTGQEGTKDPYPSNRGNLYNYQPDSNDEHDNED